jgi:L-seryl-tRNA(Ser) seleniumtransferase
VLEDLGSGALLDTARFGLQHEPTIQEAIGAGAALVTASGDKLLGGPQAGIIAGRAELIARVARHPLARAVRIDKTVLAGLAATLWHYLRDEAETEIPVWRMIAAQEDEIRRRAERLVGKLGQSGIRAESVAVASTVGGGSLPGETLPSWSVALPTASGQRVDDLARRLRLGEPGLFGRVDGERVLLDLRTVLPEDDERVLRAVQGAAAADVPQST